MLDILLTLFVFVMTMGIIKSINYYVKYQENYVRKLVGRKKYKEFKKQGEDSLHAAYFYIVNVWPEIMDEFSFWGNLTEKELSLSTQDKIIVFSSKRLDFDILNRFAKMLLNSELQKKEMKKLSKLP